MYANPKHPIFRNIVGLLFLAVILVITLAACTPKTEPTQVIFPGSQAGSDLDGAREALNGFFNLLNTGQYSQAAALYGGSYETLQGYNPDLDPNDHATLWQHGCELNGLRCLKIKTFIEQTGISATEFHFLLEFQNEDGALFVLGPCCGADETEMPPISQFEYTVIKDDSGSFLVQELPVYTP